MVGDLIKILFFCAFCQAQETLNRIAPRITRGPNVEEAQLGEIVRFYCSVRGDPLPLITWSHNKHLIRDDSNFTLIEDGNILAVKVFLGDMQGQYCCHANNGHKIQAEACGALHIKHAPHASIAPANLKVQEGSTAVFHCTLSGRPTPRIYWYHGNQSISCHQDNTLKVNILKKLCEIYKFEGSNLVIKHVTSKSTGDYKCGGWNPLGQHFSSTAHLYLAEAGNLKKGPSTPQKPVTTTKIPQKEDTGNGLQWLMAILLALVLCAIFVCVSCLVFKMGVVDSCRRNAESPQDAPSDEFEMFPNGLTTHLQFPCVVSSSVHTLEYPWYQLKFVCELGEGVFGKVYQACAKSLFEQDDEIPVAVKSLQKINSATKHDMQREAIALHKFRHPNIVQLLGVCFDNIQLYHEMQQKHGCIGPEPPFLLFEYVDGGDLCAYLRARGPYSQIFKKENKEKQSANKPQLSGVERLNMALQIACGMEYLADQQFVHRDLATRNCLISASTQNVKIADFGLSRNMYSSDYYRAGDVESVPVRWMAPESLMYGKYSTHSDIWAYGVTVWEIFTNAIQPYFGLSNQQVIHTVVKGGVLSKPDAAPLWIYKLMCMCWVGEPDHRPNFTVLSSVLKSAYFKLQGDSETEDLAC